MEEYISPLNCTRKEDYEEYIFKKKKLMNIICFHKSYAFQHTPSFDSMVSPSSFPIIKGT